MNWQSLSTQDALITAVTSAIEAIRLDRRNRYQKQVHPAGKRFSQEELTELVYPSYKNLLQSRTRRLPDRSTLIQIANYLECTLAERNQLLRSAQYEIEPLLTRERKLLTVAFVDISPSPALSQPGDDLEDVTDLLMSIWEQFEQIITNCNGVVISHIASTIVAVWGTQKVYEDDADNAVKAVWMLNSLLADVSTDDKELILRAGIHTGMALLETVGAHNVLHVNGETVNIAFQLQVALEMGLLISPATYRHVRNWVEGVRFQSDSLDKPLINGYLIHRLKSESVEADPHHLPQNHLPLAGRRQNLLQLQHHLQQVIVGGSLAVVSVEGDAGIGKSRLMTEFLAWTQWTDTALSYFTGSASAGSQQMTNLLFCEMFVYRFRLMDSDTEASLIAKFEQGFIDAIGNVAEAYTEAYILGYFLGYISKDKVDDVSLDDPKVLQERVLESLAIYFRGIADQTPIVIVLEDVHWSDHSSLYLLQRLMLKLANSPILILFTSRPVSSVFLGWVNQQAYIQRMALMALDAPECQLMIKNLLPTSAMIAPDLNQLVMERAEGNPLFIEELVHMLREQNVIVCVNDNWYLDKSRLSDQIPTTLMSILQNRLADLLPDELLVLQIASVIGYIFWDTTIVTVMNSFLPDHAQNERLVAQALTGLQHRMMILRPRNTVYRYSREFYFYHILLRDAVYITILKQDRHRYNKGAAEWMLGALKKGQFSYEYASILAGYYEAAMLFQEAIHWYQEAGRYALIRNAYSVALELFQYALDIAIKQPQTSALRASLERLIADCLDRTPPV